MMWDVLYLTALLNLIHVSHAFYTFGTGTR
jgi:hypothetical protein